MGEVGVDGKGEEVVYEAWGGGREKERGGRLTRHLTYFLPSLPPFPQVTGHAEPGHLLTILGSQRLRKDYSAQCISRTSPCFLRPHPSLPPSLPPSLLLSPQVTGHAEPGRLLAILGPSGSGKTTLLNVLAGQVPASSVLTLHGRLYVNGQLVSHSSLHSYSSSSTDHTQAYVRQQDLFYSQLTVRETLLMAARLRLPSSLTLDEKTVLVDSLLKRLGLAKAADTIVGDDKIRGISGGEKKRLSLACELLGSPSLIFADEPTSEWGGRDGGRFIYLFIYSFIHSFIYLFIYLFIYSFIY